MADDVKVTVEPATKVWYKSKTLWFALLTAAAGIFEALQGQVASGVALTFIGVANVVLRTVTNTVVKTST